jgi:glyoxylase-like metal-dependent hydrolase (beta-lactamase superfamily II)
MESAVPWEILPLHLSDVTFPASHPLAGSDGTIYGFAVRGAAGVVLFDTGVGYGHDWIDAHYRPRNRRLTDVLREHGVSPRDMLAGANSHLHFDHCGQNESLGSVPVYAQAVEYESTRGPTYTVREWVDFPGATYRLLDGETEIVSGVRLLPTPGHTPGHQSLLVETERGPAVLAEQAVYSAAEFELIRRTGRLHGNDPPPDPAAYLASAQRLMELRPHTVYFSHDAVPWHEPDGVR